MQKDVIFTEIGNILVAEIQSDIDHHSAKAMREKIDTALFEKRARTLVIDFSRVQFMDSSGLGLILGRVERAGALGAEVQVSGLSPTLMKLVRLAGIEHIPGLSLTR